MSENLIVNACINGMTPTRNKNPHTPVTPEEIIKETMAVCRLGASIVHIHARDGAERPTWEPSYYREIIAGIRQSVPGVIICVTTSGRLWSEPEKRAAAMLLEGREKPDMASLTLGSFNFPGTVSLNPPQTIDYLLDIMSERGIVPELELFDLGMVDYAAYLLSRGKIRMPIYANILLGNRGTADACRENLAYMVGRLPEKTLWSAAGIGKSQSPVHQIALSMGGHVRVGIEDNLYIDHRTRQPATNAELIARVLDDAKGLGRLPMPAEKVRALLSIGKTSLIPPEN